MFTKFPNKLYIGGSKTNLIWPSVNSISKEKKLKFVFNIFIFKKYIFLNLL